MKRTTVLATCIVLSVHGLSVGDLAGVVAQSGVKGGLVVCIGCGDGREMVSQPLDGGFLVHGLDTNSSLVCRARQRIDADGLHGSVSADTFDGERLPYVDNLVNLVAVSSRFDVPAAEVRRVLAPGGVACFKDGGEWRKEVKPRPPDIDDWGHYLYDASGNPVARDQRVGPPRRLQWEAGPHSSRNHEKMSSVSVVVSAGGRVFSIMDAGPLESVFLPSRWSLTARDAFNGVVLWKRRIDPWHSQLFPLKSGPFQLTRRLVAVDDRVYVTPGLYAPVSEVDAATGETVRTFAGTEYTEEIIHAGNKLILVVNNRKEPIPYGGGKDKAGGGYTIAVEAPSRSVAVIDTRSGMTAWIKESGSVTPLTLTAAGDAVFFHAGQQVRCLDMANGNVQWSQPVERKTKLSTGQGPALLIHNDVLCFAEMKSLTGLSTKDGRQLWHVPCDASVYRSPVAVCAIDGIAWVPESMSWKTNVREKGKRGFLVGYDLETGKKVRSLPVDEEQGVGVCHARCTMPKATGKYLVTSWPGVEFTDTTTGTMKASHWVRGACLFGLMPANGLLYAPPNPCACYPEGKLNGFLALAPQGQKNDGLRLVGDQRFVKGPLFGKIDGAKLEHVPADGWPTLRGDNERSGSTRVSVSTGLTQRWTARLGGTLTQPVIADGKVFVASSDARKAIALDAESGKVRWEFIAGGRVDSPPTWHDGIVVFGCRDGCVYSLCAETGALVWRFNAARNDRRVVSYGQLESPWPVSGSVLARDDTLWFVAGKSGFLEGGITLYRLNAATGREFSRTVIDMLDPNGRQPTVTWLSMPGALPDVLSSDGEYVYMRHITFDLEGRRVDHPGNNHIYRSTGFVDRSGFHRTFWKYGQGSIVSRIGIASGGGLGSKVLVMDKERLFHYGRAQAATRAIHNNERFFLTSTSRAMKGDSSGAKQKKGGKKRGRASAGTTVAWQHPFPIHVRAMVLADRTLFVAGPKGDWINSADVFEGRKGISLSALSAADGRVIAEIALPALPVFDGLSAAYGQLFLSDEKGVVTCFAGE
jgi:outer membrane protein assembly factor BamB